MEPSTGYNALQSIKFGVEGGYYNYQEPQIMESEGGLFGIFGEFKRHNPNSRFFLDTLILDASIKGGRTDYTSNATGSINEEGNFIAETRASVGKGFDITNTLLITPYVGIGYRLFEQ